MPRAIRRKDVQADTSDVVKRLDAILNTLLEMPASEGRQLSLLKRVQILNSSGLRNIEIAKILGLTPTHVSVVIDTIRKRSGKTRKGKTRFKR